MPEIKVVENILDANDQIAARTRQQLDALGVVALNIMASPGGGKTSVIMQTISALKDEARIGVMEGDVVMIDVEKVAALGVPVTLVNTGGNCHLDANMVSSALPSLPMDALDLLIIENVGNLICPVGFDLGQSYHVGLLSVPEGHDKPYKYPSVFEAVDAVLVTKLDLLPYLDFDQPAFEALVRGLNPTAPILPLSARDGAGVPAWIAWLEAKAGA